jgi:hypothetical protein
MARDIQYESLEQYKYRLTKSLVFQLPERFHGFQRTLDFIELDHKGKLTLKKGFCWDGPSGPTIDTDSAMPGSAAHDALYRLMRKGKLPYELRKYADRFYMDICDEDGMHWFRCNTHLYFLALFGAKNARPEKDE